MRSLNQLFGAAFGFILLGCSHFAIGQAPIYYLNSNLPTSPILVDAGSDLTPLEVFTPQQLSGSASGGQGALQYSWMPTTGLDSADISSPTLTYSVSVSQYVLSVTDELGCTSMDTIDIDFSVSNQELAHANVSLEIAPNPSRGDFHLRVSGSPIKGKVDLVVLDAVGRRVYEESGLKFSGSLERNLSLGNLHPGMYFLGLSGEGHQTVKRLIIQ